MTTRAFRFGVLISAILVSVQGGAQPAQKEGSPGREMARLAKVLAGDWKTTETMERSQLFPNGGFRHGVVHARLAAGGTTLIYEVSSNGSAGKLDGFLTIWWDKDSQLYHFFACFNDPDRPCHARGTAHWEGEVFVNDYDETIDGKKTAWRDSFTFTSSSHTLVAAMNTDHDAWKTFITTTAVRR